MKYKYTWNHLLLLAKVCGRIDDEDSVTASWVQITEEHNQQTFPFTLWPLTYRTCEVTTSPAMCTPVHIRTTDYNVKMFKSNEVVIICIQDNIQDSSRDSVCRHPCVAEFDGENDDGAIEIDTGSNDAENHVDKHCLSQYESLLPCHEAHCYNRMKTRVTDAFYEIQDHVECVICTGHGEAAAMASCLASDMSQTYEDEKKFLGLDETRVIVDFVGFSNSVFASTTYWDKHSASIDQYILVGLKRRAATSKISSSADTELVINPRCMLLTIDALPMKTLPMSRSTSVFNKIINKTKRDKQPKQPKDFCRHISEYIQALNNRITLPAMLGLKS